MDANVVAIRVVDADQGECGVLTWAGLYDPASAELLEAVAPHFRKLGLRRVELAEVRPLDELSGLLSFSEGVRKFKPPPPDGSAFESWRSAKRAALAAGDELV